MNDLLNLSPDEWTAVRLSLRVATVAMLAISVDDRHRPAALGAIKRGGESDDSRADDGDMLAH